MGKRKRLRNFECVYCGSDKDPTDDHIPAKNIFPAGQRVSLITVPSCKKCNGAWSKDDGYLRRLIFLRQDMTSHPATQELLPPVRRELSRPEGRSELLSLVNELRQVRVQTPSGLYAGPGVAYPVDVERLEGIAARIIKGLYFHERKYRLPDDYRVSAYFGDLLLQATGQLRWHLGCLYAKLTSSPPKTVGGEVFAYWHQRRRTLRIPRPGGCRSTVASTSLG